MPSPAIAIPARPAGTASGRTFSHLVTHLASGLSVKDSSTYLQYHDAYASFIRLGQEMRQVKHKTTAFTRSSKTSQSLHFSNFSIKAPGTPRFPVYPAVHSYATALHSSSLTGARTADWIQQQQQRGEDLDEALMFETQGAPVTGVSGLEGDLVRKSISSSMIHKPSTPIPIPSRTAAVTPPAATFTAPIPAAPRAKPAGQLPADMWQQGAMDGCCNILDSRAWLQYHEAVTSFRKTFELEETGTAPVYNQICLTAEAEDSIDDHAAPDIDRSLQWRTLTDRCTGRH